MPDPNHEFRHFIKVDGGPGTGKSTTIIKNTTEGEWRNKRVCVVTFTNAAADVLKLRAPWITSGTVYSLLWPYVSPVLPKEYTKRFGPRGGAAASGYKMRAIDNYKDVELMRYHKEAPGRRPASPDSLIAAMLHAWDGNPDEVPVDFKELAPTNEIKYILPMGYWIVHGPPLPEDALFDVVVIDEAQDMSALEVECALRMVKPGGLAYAYGDPGQAIYSQSKGMLPDELPYAWKAADEKLSLSQGYRCGPELTKAANAVLKDYYDLDPELFTANHQTMIHTWNPMHKGTTPDVGLVMGHSRRSVVNYFQSKGLANTPVVPGISDPDKELVVCTGHAAKGAQADNVYVLPWSDACTMDLYSNDPDRVKLLYVMMTRAKKNLYLPQDLHGFVNAKILRAND